MLFSNVSIKKKISAVFLLVSVLLSMFLYFFVSQVKYIQEMVEVFADTTVPSIVLVKNLQNEVLTLREEQFMLLANLESDQKNSIVAEISHMQSKIEGSVEEYRQGLWDERDERAFAAVDKSWKQYRDVHSQFMAAIDSGRFKQAVSITNSGAVQFDNLKQAIADLELLNTVYADEDEQGTKERVESAILYSAIGVAGVIGFMIISAIMLIRQICNPLTLVIDMAGKIAAGDLTHQLQRDKIGNDELGELADTCSEMQANLLSLVDQISSTSNQLGASIEEVNSISEQALTGMNEQKDQLSLVATAMNQIQATVNDVAGNTEAASRSAGEATLEAKNGSDVVQLCVSKIEQAESSIRETGEMIEDLEKDASNISVVVDVIQSIAEQTNLLALNAAIEAARAGEQGRGFAVVADEVRVLAGRTHDSTEEVVSIINSLQSRSKETVLATQKSGELIQSCVEQTLLAGEVIQQIGNGVDSIAEMSIQVASTCSEQSSVTEDLHRNVEQINDFSEGVTLGASQTVQACSDLGHQAANLLNIVQKFKIS
ncbi:methyl-accepting chemotaxis protein [Vibrio sp. SCSIO 43137]|uniref:methyl-accepting chemotaxis protein n=1 Tax=Vibrio sp. SCSIO 43137 TaxID=3021011 RepID=UPI0023076940|nr:methyl-accepting chemotaxis protein [Vibrio sp. SCSIO 43137]WCE32276.1 methyl-accepting chemotaxis protein [Vibrio sp. SCSIO 43137]